VAGYLVHTLASGVHHVVSLVSWMTACVENIRCGGNDLRLGFYAAEWNNLSGDTMFVLCGDEDHD